MKTIIIPVDFSDNAKEALQYTINFLGDSQAKLYCIYIMEPYVPSSETAVASTSLFKEQLDLAKDRLVEFCQEFEEKLPSNISIESEVILGNIASSIRQKAKDISADAIFMGTQGENHNVLERLLGTVSTLMVENAPCPVLLIPHPYDFKPMDNVIYCTDMNHEDPYEIWRAVELLKPNSVIVQCVHVVKSEQDKEKTLESDLKDYVESNNSAVKTVFSVEVGDDVSQVASDYADNYDAEMIIMTRTKHSAFYRILHGSETKKMISHLHIPLLIMNKKKLS